jgi:hypothetical protein
MLKSMSDLVDPAFEDEEISEEEEQAVARAREWFKHNEGIPMEEILAEFGLTMEDFEKMGSTPLPGEVE